MRCERILNIHIRYVNDDLLAFVNQPTCNSFDAYGCVSYSMQ